MRELISGANSGAEIGAFNTVMSFAISTRYVPASHRFEGKPKLKTMRRDEFTSEEYRKLHSLTFLPFPRLKRVIETCPSFA